MIARFLGRTRAEEQLARDLYESIVAQARQPIFYRDLAVPDTVDGRFEMIVLHLVLLFHRLQTEGTEGQSTAQRVFDLFVTDMDMSLREMGVGDLGVPKRMKDVGRSFYGRLEAYGKPLADSNRGQMEEALQRNLFPEESGRAEDISTLTDYTINAAAHLGGTTFADIVAGNLTFPVVAPREHAGTA